MRFKSDELVFDVEKKNMYRGKNKQRNTRGISDKKIYYSVWRCKSTRTDSTAVPNQTRESSTCIYLSLFRVSSRRILDKTKALLMIFYYSATLINYGGKKKYDRFYYSKRY